MLDRIIRRIRRWTKKPSLHQPSSPAEVFSEIYNENLWAGRVSRSGTGSDPENTRALSGKLPQLVKKLGAKSFLDIPCGDLAWMKDVDLGVSSYIGADIVTDLIKKNSARFAADKRRTFAVKDLTKDALPQADIVFCRDCLVHLSYADIAAAIRNVAASGAKYLLCTTFIRFKENADIKTGDWRRLNMTLPPFHFPAPVELIDEEYTASGPDYADKCIGAWRVSDLPSLPQENSR